MPACEAVSASSPDAVPGRAERRAVDRFRVGWLKLFADGSVGSRTAAMLEPYDDAPTRPGPVGPHGGLLESRDRARASVSNGQPTPASRR